MVDVSPGQRETYWASPEDGRAFALGLNSQFLECRTDRCWWEDHDVRGPDADNVFQIVQRCSRGCTSERSREVSAISGRRLSGWSYKRPDGFHAKGIGRIAGEEYDYMQLLKTMDSKARLTGKPNPLRKALPASRKRVKDNE